MLEELGQERLAPGALLDPQTPRALTQAFASAASACRRLLADPRSPVTGSARARSSLFKPASPRELSQHFHCFFTLLAGQIWLYRCLEVCFIHRLVHLRVFWSIFSVFNGVLVAETRSSRCFSRCWLRSSCCASVWCGGLRRMCSTWCASSTLLVRARRSPRPSWSHFPSNPLQFDLIEGGTVACLFVFCSCCPALLPYGLDGLALEGFSYRLWTHRI